MSAASVSRRVFVQRFGGSLALMGFAPAFAPGLTSSLMAAPTGSNPLPRSTPEAQGVRSTQLIEVVDALEKLGPQLHSLMVVRHGHVIAEGWWAPYAHNLRHTLYSLSKSFTSTALGIAADEGKVSVNDPVTKFFADDLPATVSPNLAAMQVRHLLMMGTGHARDALNRAATNWVKETLALPVEFEPGTHFVYNNAATYLVSAIVQKVTGQTVLDYLKPRLFEPLGIEGADWEVNSQGINTGAWGLRVKTEDIAKLGQLYLQNGKWNGKQLLSKQWVTDATSKQIENLKKDKPEERETSDWAQGYGYQFWRCRHGNVRGDGAYGQFCVMLPEQDAVVAITSETGDLQGVLNHLWKTLLPAFSTVPLTVDKDSASRLQERLEKLSLPVPMGAKTSPQSGMFQREYKLAENSLGYTRATFQFDNASCKVTLVDATGAHSVVCGLGSWKNGVTRISPRPLHLALVSFPDETPIAAAAAWKNETTLEMNWRFIETAHYQLVTCRFAGEEVQIEFTRSASVLNPNAKDPRPVLVGR